MKLSFSENVYEPQEDSYLMQELVGRYAFGRVLDVGTGSGILAIAAAANPKVREVVASDINPEALKLARKNALQNGVQIRTVLSDLFERIPGMFDFIIFNPPYLPEEKNAEKDMLEMALCGGKRGYETIERFISELPQHLNRDGLALVAFSSITGRKRVEEIIRDNLLKSELAGSRKVAFEELYALLIRKSEELKQLESLGIRVLKKIAKGHRGVVHLGIFKGKKVAVKLENPESKAVGRIENEARFLGILAKEKFKVPKLFFWKEKFLVEEFLEGDKIEEYLQKCSGEEALKVIIGILKECRRLDSLKIEKGEMHHPTKHIIVGNKGTFKMIDFERARFTKKPSNTTQFCQFIISRMKLLNNKKITVNAEELKRLCSKYKKDYAEEVFKKIVKCIQLRNG
ncbi:MAG: methyltransferase [Candidatus Woesearchaeota archaeon]